MTTETHPHATALQLAVEVLGMTESEYRTANGGITVDANGDIRLTNAAARRILATVRNPLRTLGDLINTLAALDPALPLDGGYGFCSWRGDYEDVSLTPGDTTLVTSTQRLVVAGYGFDEATGWDRRPPATTVGALLEVARAVTDGGQLSGYKGGVYAMWDDTELWADPWGQCPGRKARIDVEDGVVRVLASV